jgi:hypothetical protein
MGGDGDFSSSQNWRFTVPVRRRSGAKILWHGGDFWERKEGKTEEERRGYKGVVVGQLGSLNIIGRG